MQLENKRCIITGGGRDIGKTIALAFAGDGANSVSTLRIHPEDKSAKKEIMDSSEQFFLIHEVGKAKKTAGK